MGTETYFPLLSVLHQIKEPVKLNNPLMGTKTIHNRQH